MKPSGVRSNCLLLLFLYCMYMGLVFPLKAQDAERSVLADGDWYKMSVSQYGMYKLDYSFLKEAGINVSSIDPAKIRLFGQGGGMLPQSNSEPRPEGLIENAIFIRGGEDGKFDPEDYILFYAEGPDLYRYDNDTEHFFYQKNLYTDTTFYFLTISKDNGARIQDQSNEGLNFTRITSFDDYGAYEKDLANILESGREWYGEKFGLTPTHTLPPFYFPGIISGSEIRIISAVLSQSNSPSSFSLSVNNTSVGEQKLRSISVGTYDIKGFSQTDTLSINTSSISFSEPGALTFSYTYQKGSFGTSAANLNFLFLQVKRALALYDNQTVFRSLESLAHSSVTYSLKSASPDISIWDITDPQKPAKQAFDYKEGQAMFGAGAHKLRTYIAFKGSDFSTPATIKKIRNQNLRGESVPELLLITDPAFKPAAERLANFRASHDGLSVKIVTPDEIFNEFSSGRQDVSAIRDYVKYLYDQGKRLKYLLLFGKGSYDYKGYIDNNTNFVPTYESRNSLNPVETYSSDDYFGFLDDHEGEWPEGMGVTDHLLDIGVGRLPVKSLAEAHIMVDKLIHYSSSEEALGTWRNELYLIADDGDKNTHQQDAEKIAVLTDTTFSAFNINKIYLDAYPQETLPNGEVAPQVREEINKAIKNGALMINYTGHGAEGVLADESVVTTDMISKWENYDRLPLFVTATCEFGRHDDPKRASGGELLLSSPKGGAIGLVTTSRPVFSSSNFLLNQAFTAEVFKQVDGKYKRLGDIFKATKNNSLSGVRNRNFSLLGDPSMTLAYPRYEAVIFNARQGPDSSTLKALSKVELEGEVRDHKSNRIHSYNGIAYVSIFGKPSTVETFGTENSPVMTFKQRDNVIFRGKASIVQGRFAFNFVVPKNIAYDLGNAKVSLYTMENNSLNDAHGANQDLIIGGSNPDAVPDNTPPVITLYMDDTTFETGGITGSNTLLLAYLEDENGINISNRGIGQELTVQLNDEEPEILNDFYQATLDSYKSGWVSYPIDGLAEGRYTLHLKAWDTYNNASEKSIEFIVADDAKLALDEIFNYPNPFSDDTRFIIKHNRAGENISVRIIIYSIQGKLIKEISGNFMHSNATISDLTWNGLNDFGKKVGNGVYLYKVIVQSEKDAAKKQQLQKLVIIN